jgi:hypothetical protein
MRPRPTDPTSPTSDVLTARCDHAPPTRLLQPATSVRCDHAQPTRLLQPTTSVRCDHAQPTRLLRQATSVRCDHAQPTRPLRPATSVRCGHAQPTRLRGGAAQRSGARRAFVRVRASGRGRPAGSWPTRRAHDGRNVPELRRPMASRAEASEVSGRSCRTRRACDARARSRYSARVISMSSIDVPSTRKRSREVPTSTKPSAA